MRDSLRAQQDLLIALVAELHRVHFDNTASELIRELSAQSKDIVIRHHDHMGNHIFASDGGSVRRRS